MKLWEKSTQIDKEIERFTVGRDREMDLYLAPYDVLGSMAHITMLQSIDLLTEAELKDARAKSAAGVLFACVDILFHRLSVFRFFASLRMTTLLSS